MADWVSATGSVLDGTTVTITPATSEAWMLNNVMVSSDATPLLISIGVSSAEFPGPQISGRTDFGVKYLITNTTPLLLTLPASSSTFFAGFAYTGIKL